MCVCVRVHASQREWARLKVAQARGLFTRFVAALIVVAGAEKEREDHRGDLQPLRIMAFSCVVVLELSRRRAERERERAPWPLHTYRRYNIRPDNIDRCLSIKHDITFEPIRQRVTHLLPAFVRLNIISLAPLSITRIIFVPD